MARRAGLARTPVSANIRPGFKLIPHNGKALPVLEVAGLVVANSLLADGVWRVVRAKRRNVRSLGRFLAGLFSLSNLAIAVISFQYLWKSGWDWFYFALLLTGLIFAFRFGGATSGQYR